MSCGSTFADIVLLQSDNRTDGFTTATKQLRRLRHQSLFPIDQVRGALCLRDVSISQLWSILVNEEEQPEDENFETGGVGSCSSSPNILCKSPSDSNSGPRRPLGALNHQSTGKVLRFSSGSVPCESMSLIESFSDSEIQVGSGVQNLPDTIVEEDEDVDLFLASQPNDKRSRLSIYDFSSPSHPSSQSWLSQQRDHNYAGEDITSTCQTPSDLVEEGAPLAARLHESPNRLIYTGNKFPEICSKGQISAKADCIPENTGEVDNTPRPPATNGFQKATGLPVVVAKSRLRRAAMFFEGSIRVGHPPICAGYSDDNVVALSMTNDLWNTTNSSISLTADLLEQASEVSENGPLRPAHSQGQGCTPPILASPSMLGFQTAAGRMIPIAQEKLNDAASLLAEPPNKTAHAEGRGCAPSPRPVVSDMLGFQTAAGRMIPIAQEKLNDAASLLTEQSVESQVGVSAVSMNPLRKEEADKLSGGTLRKFITRRLKQGCASHNVTSASKRNSSDSSSKKRARGFKTPRPLPPSANNVVKGRGGSNQHHVKRQKSSQRPRVCIAPSNDRITMAELRRCEIASSRSSTISEATRLRSFGVTSSNAVLFTFISDFGDEISWCQFREKMMSGTGSVGNPEYLTPSWIANHYRWIIWKLAAMERRFPSFSSGNWLTVRTVLRQLHFRYQREFEEGRRSSLKTILEGDAPSSRLVVLCISRLESSANIVELTDGWYAVEAILDPEMVSLATKNKLQVGMKLCVQQASLVDWTSGISPLECRCNHVIVNESYADLAAPKLLITKNGCRPAAWDCRLGFQPVSFFRTSLKSLDPLGGVAGCVEVLVERVYPPVYKEQLPNGSTILRSESAEYRAREDHCRNTSQQVIGTEFVDAVPATRSVNHFFSIDVIDPHKGSRASITLWGAHIERWDALVNGSIWRFLGLLPRKAKRNDIPSFSYGKRSSCSLVQRTSSKDLLEQVGFIYRHRSMIGSLMHTAVGTPVDVVAVMVDEAPSDGGIRHVFFVDESGCMMSLKIPAILEGDIPTIRKGHALTLLNIIVAGYDSYNSLLVADWQHHSTLSAMTCEVEFRATLYTDISRLRNWISSTEGNCIIEQLCNSKLVRLFAEITGSFDSVGKAYETAACTYSGHIIGLRWAEGTGRVLVDFQDGHGLAKILEVDREQVWGSFLQVLGAGDRGSEKSWVNMPLELAQMFVEAQVLGPRGDVENIVEAVRLDLMTCQRKLALLC